MATAVDADFSNLLARLYSGIEGEKPWGIFLEALAQWMNATYATLIIAAPGTRQPGTYVTPGADPQHSANYINSFFADDPFRGLPEGQVTSLAQFSADHPDALNDAYREYLRLAGSEQVLGVDLRFGGGTAGDFEARFRVTRKEDHEDFTAADRNRFQGLVQHLRIAVGLFEKLQFAGAEHGVFHSAAQGMGLALVVLDRARNIVSSNALAEAIMREGEGVMRRGEAIAFSVLDNRHAIDAILAGGDADYAVSPDTTRFLIERPQHGDLVATARALDLPAIHSGAGALALFLARASGDIAPDPQLLRDLLGLTLAEARIASALGEGLTLAEAATKLGIAHNTAKAQLRAVFAKTGVNRQAQLVALLAALAG